MKHDEIVEVLEILLENRLWTLRGTPTNQTDLDLMLEYHDEGDAVTFAEITEKREVMLQNRQEQEITEKANKAVATAKLAALGLTTDDLKALGLGTN